MSQPREVRDLIDTVVHSRLPDDHVFKNGLTMRDLRAAVDAACTRVERRKRSRDNCAHVRMLMQERYPLVWLAYEQVVRDS